MVITETKQSKTNKNKRTEMEDELNINKQNKTEIKEIKENRNKNMNMITVCAWTAGIFSGTKCNHFPIFFPVFYYFFFFSVYFLWTSFLAPFFSNYRAPSRPSFYHSASAGFMESVILNQEYLAKVVLWKKLELKARHNRSGTCYTHIHCINSAKGICSRKSSENPTLNEMRCRQLEQWNFSLLPSQT